MGMCPARPGRRAQRPCPLRKGRTRGLTVSGSAPPTGQVGACAREREAKERPPAETAGGLVLAGGIAACATVPMRPGRYASVLSPLLRVTSTST